MKTYIGIDVGKLGGIVALRDGECIEKCPMPLIGNEIDPVGLTEIMFEIRRKAQSNIVCVIEDVHSLFQAGAKANFQFGRALGVIEGIIGALGIAHYKVSPKTWQKVCFEGIPVMKKSGPIREGRGSTDTKPMAALAAKRLYPNLVLTKSDRASVPHSGIVDALLMAHYASLKY